MTLAKRVQIYGLLVGAVACGGGGTTDNNNNNGGNQQPPQQPGGTPVPTASVDVNNNYFTPNSVLLAAGGTVTWNWVGDNGHSVTSYASPTFTPNAPVSYPQHTLVVTFPNTGDYQYYCTTHGVGAYGGISGMTGAIYVR
jgi:plastocyanin